MSHEIGSRVGVILGMDDGVVNFLGYGVYEGDFPIPPEARGMAVPGMLNPRIKLDNGKIVWGCECWWGSEEKIREDLDKYVKSGLVLSVVDIDDARAQQDSTVQ
jgi:hypothetical protein